MLVICSFFGTALFYLQQKLLLSNQLLRQLGCLNPVKRKKDSTVSSIESLNSTLQTKVNETEVVDEWKVFHIDYDLPVYDPKERIEVFWKQVFEIQTSNGDHRYKVLPVVVKSALVLAQTNAESEHSLSVNARIVTEERSSLSEKTIIGLHVVKEAVWFSDPVSNQTQQIPIEPDMKKAVNKPMQLIKNIWRQRKKWEEKERRKKTERYDRKEKKEEAKLLKNKESLAKSEEDLHEQGRTAREELKAADELLKDAKTKLDEALSFASVNKTSVSVARMMLDTATTKCEEAITKLDKIRGVEVHRDNDL